MTVFLALGIGLSVGLTITRRRTAYAVIGVLWLPVLIFDVVTLSRQGNLAKPEYWDFSLVLLAVAAGGVWMSSHLFPRRRPIPSSSRGAGDDPKEVL